MAGSSVRKTKLAYKFYSALYEPLALFAMYFVWHARLRPLLRWYRDTYPQPASGPILDVATGDGGLTLLALGKKLRGWVPRFLDLSPQMLKKARRRFPALPDSSFIEADVLRMPIAPASEDRIACFGGVHVFPERTASIRALAEALKPGGLLRGSILLLPSARYSRAMCRLYVDMGFLASTPTEAELENDFAAAGLLFTRRERNGDMLLFEARKG
jgi:ubiquinone/menaquinone biosynthesis C-methylase UbiE